MNKQQAIQLDIVQAVATHVIEGFKLRSTLESQGAFRNYVSTVLPAEMDALVVRLVSLFAAENIRNVEVKFPLNWWEAFKERWAPQPWLDRWPVKYHYVTVDVKAIWAGFTEQAKEAWRKGPLLPYVLETSRTDEDDDE